MIKSRFYALGLLSLMWMTPDIGKAQTVDAGVPPSQSPSVSVGAPNDGQLLNGVAMPERGDGFVHNAKRPNREARYGTTETIAALVEAGRLFRNNPLSQHDTIMINDIGLPRGGTIPHHGSHQSGRDVDILFFYLDKKGKPFSPMGIPVDPKGQGWEFGELSDPKDDIAVHLDVPKLWAMVSALIEQEKAQIQRIFIAEHVRTLLIDFAIKSKAPISTRRRFESITCQPEHPHDDHLHVRFFCPPDDVPLGCLDTWPVYPWQEAYLKQYNVVAQMAQPKFRKPRGGRGSLVSKSIEKTAHKRVLEFLRARELWYVKPHPGREYCK